MDGLLLVLFAHLRVNVLKELGKTAKSFCPQISVGNSQLS